MRIPGVIKLQNGEYTPLKLPMDIEETVQLRANIIRHTALSYKPDVFIVDKEPHGLRGEVLDTLIALKERGTQLVLGLRDILDDPLLLAPEWQTKNVLPALENLYDEIWIYGLPQVSNPLEGLDLPAAITRKTTYTGYLCRALRSGAPAPNAEKPFGDRPYILVTAGGDGDGEMMFDWVLRAYENDSAQPVPAFFVFGPFLDPDLVARFTARIAKLQNVESITFDTHPETLISEASGIVAMGGYNTVCEILSFDRPSLIVPRTKPRLEQFLRASRMQEMGLVKRLVPEAAAIDQNSAPDWKLMATALRHLPQQRVPSKSSSPKTSTRPPSRRRWAAPSQARARTAARRLPASIRTAREAAPESCGKCLKPRCNEPDSGTNRHRIAPLHLSPAPPLPAGHKTAPIFPAIRVTPGDLTV